MPSDNVAPASASDAKDSVAAIYAESTTCPGNVDRPPVEDDFGAVDDWAEVLEAPSDVVGEKRPAALGPIVAELVTTPIDARAPKSERYELSELWTAGAIAAVADPDVSVFVGRGRPSFAPEAAPMMLLVVAIGATDVALAGQCVAGATDRLHEAFGAEAPTQVRSLLAMPPSDARDLIQELLDADGDEPTSTAPPQLLPGLSEVEGLDADALEEHRLTIELADRAANESQAVCIATEQYLGFCAELGAFAESPDDSGRLALDFSILATPGERIRLLSIPNGTEPGLGDITDIAFDESLTARVLLTPLGTSYDVEPLPVVDPLP